MSGLGRKTFTAGEVLTAANVNGYLMDQSVMVFAGTAARASAIGTPSAGMMSYLTDTNSLQVYGTAWADVSNPGDITAVTAGTALSGGGSSGDVTLDVNLTALATAVVGTALAADAGTINVNLTALATAVVGTALAADAGIINVDLAAVGTGITINANQITNTVSASTATAYTLASSDEGKVLQFTGASAVITVGTATALNAGERIDILDDGGGMTVSAESTAIALYGAGTAGTAYTVGNQYEAVTILSLGSDSYRIIGNITAV